MPRRKVIVAVLPHSHDGVYGEKFSGFNTRLYLDTKDFLDLGKPEHVEVTVRIPRF